VIFSETPLPGAFVIEPELLEDERGFFARTWCERELTARGLVPRIAQCSTSFNKKKGTLRGLHYQAPPFEETKIVRCIRGSMYDVIVDLRPDSATFTRHFAVVLTAENRKMLYIPAGFAHGFLTLADDTEVTYRMGARYVPDAARGVRWDDPRLGIAWPARPAVISERDAAYPDLDPERIDA